MNPQPLLPSDPMPGEVLKENNGENGEINNPYYNPGFENLANENQEENKEHDSDNVAGKEFDASWDNGVQPDLRKIKDSINAKYIEGAAIQSSTNANARADMAKANSESIGNDHDKNGPRDDKLYKITKADSIDTIGAVAKADDAIESYNRGNLDALADAENIEQQLTEAEMLANKIPESVAENADNRKEAEMAINVANQVHEMVSEKRAELTEKKAEIDSMSAEEKEETTEAAEAAEANGTSIEVEKQRIEEEKKAEAEKEAADDAQFDNGVTIDHNMLS